MEEKEAEQEMKTGNFSKARELYDTLLRRNKRKVQFLLGKADCLVLEGRLTDSLQFYSEALKTGKVRPDRLFCLISGLAQVVDQETANISSSPSDESTILQCGDCTGILSEPITVPCGHTFCKLCLEKQGSKSCTRCGESTSHVSLKTNVVLRDILGKCFESELEATRLRLEGNCFHRKKQSEEAITKYLEAEQLNNSDHLVQSNLACVLTLLERFEEAVLKANRACELQPSWPKGYYRKGCALLGLNKKIEAVVAFIHCLARDPENKSVKKSLAKVLHELLSESTPSSNCDMDMAEMDPSEDTDLCLQKLERILDLLEPSKTEYTSEDAGSEPNIKKLKLDKTCCVEDLECTLCCRLFYEPVTTPCGHVFCRSCLNCNLDHRPSCPICRFSLRKYLAERNQNITVAVSCLIETHLKEEYQERKRQHEAEMEKLASVASDTKEDVPIFVCTLAFPSLPCPLHIFEPRYRLMMRQCMESGSQQFGMVLPDEEKCFADYGVMLEIRELQYLPDGRSFVDCIGGRRFKVLERGMQNGYHTAKVEWIKDEQIPEEEISEVKALHQEVYNEAKTWFTDLPLLARRRIMNTFPDMPNCDSEPQNLPQGPTWMWWLLSVCPLSPQAQLEFMAMPSLKARLRKLQQLLASLRARERMF